MQGKRSVLFIGACFIGALLYSCHSSKKAAVSDNSSPRFMNDITVHANKNSAASGSKQPAKATHPQPHGNTSVTVAEAEAIKKRYAALLSVKPKDLQNINLYKFIDGWYGLNYKYGGTQKKGIDCSAFTQKLYSEVYGINLVRTAMEQFGKCQQVKPGSAKEGDLVFFSIESKRITHVGIYLANNFFVHSSSSGGIAISNLKEDYWQKYYTGTGRIPHS